MRTTLIAIALGLVFCASTTLLPAAVEPMDEGGRGIVAVQAGTIHLVEDGQVLEGGTILIKNGRILAVGSDVEVPMDAHVVDYGTDAVIVPGLVAAKSGLGSGFASVRALHPTALVWTVEVAWRSGSKLFQAGFDPLHQPRQVGRAHRTERQSQVVGRNRHHPGVVILEQMETRRFGVETVGQLEQGKYARIEGQ